LVEINDFSHVMVHNLTGWPAAVGVQIVARPWQDSTALAVAGFVEKVFGGWRPPPPVAA
jgi:amidase